MFLKNEPNEEETISGKVELIQEKSEGIKEKNTCRTFDIVAWLFFPHVESDVTRAPLHTYTHTPTQSYKPAE